MRNVLIRVFWSIIIVLSVYYLYRGLRFRFIEEGLGPTFWDKQFWFIVHIGSAIMALALGPVQFWTRFRRRYAVWHRTLGKVYVLGSLIGGATAFYLGVTQPYQGSIVPVVLLSWVWMFMTVSALVAIRRRMIEVHRLFVIRSYVLALTFVTLRLLGDLTEHANLLFFIDNTEVADTTYEWMSWVLPLLVCELLISWYPALARGVRRPGPAGAEHKILETELNLDSNR